MPKFSTSISLLDTENLKNAVATINDYFLQDLAVQSNTHYYMKVMMEILRFF